MYTMTITMHTYQPGVFYLDFLARSWKRRSRSQKVKVSEHKHLRRQKGFDHAIWINMVQSDQYGSKVI